MLRFQVVHLVLSDIRTQLSNTCVLPVLALCLNRPAKPLIESEHFQDPT